jgi:hypothetical protein
MFKKIAAVTTLLLAATGAIAAEYVDPAAGFVSTRTRAEVKAEVLKGNTPMAKSAMGTSGMSKAGVGSTSPDKNAIEPLHLRFNN